MKTKKILTIPKTTYFLERTQNRDKILSILSNPNNNKQQIYK